MAQLLTGKEVVDHLHEDIAKRIAVLEGQNINPTLALVRMGENPDDLSYERTAVKRAQSLGVETRSYVLDTSAPQSEVDAVIEGINADPEVHGCLLFRPLPRSIDEQRVCDALALEKDVDGVSLTSLAAVFTDAEYGFAPCTAAACVETLDFYQIPLEGKQVVVVGRSLVVGKPLSMMLLKRNATVTMCHSRTKDLAGVCKRADIVVCATGKAKAFGAEYFREGQVVLDVGINFDADGNLCGDVDLGAVEPIVQAITPVPRGIGSVTTSILMMHTVQAAERVSGTVPHAHFSITDS